MRIAHVTATFPPHYTGTGIVSYQNSLGLARRGHQVTVFTDNFPPGDFVYPQELSVRRLPALFRFGNAPFLPGLLGIEGFDVVHLHYPFYFGAETILFKALASGLRYILTYHQDVLFAGPMRVPERIHHNFFGRYTLARACKVLATSLDYAGASRLKELMRKKPGTVAELPNGVDAARFHPEVDCAGLRRRYSLKDTDLVVLFVGALDRAHFFKGIDGLLQAMSGQANREVKLLVVGDGNLRSTYQEKAISLGLRDRVIFCGRVPDEDLPSHYALCDLLVLPSTTMGEAFGLVLLEAMSCAKPVIASNLPGVRSVVSNGEDGLLVKPGDSADLADKILILLEDPQRRRTMGERGRMKVEQRYAWPKIIDRLEAIYESVVPDLAGLQPRQV